MTLANGDFLDFSGKVVLITGAATGIGRAVAVAFAGRGAKVAIGDINEEAARETLYVQMHELFSVGEDRDRFVRTADGWKLVSRQWVELFARGDVLKLP